MSKDEIIVDQSNKILDLESENERIKHENAELKRLIFGSKSERFKSDQVSADQLSMFAGAPNQNIEPPKEKISYERKKAKAHPGRNKLPEHLPVEEIVIEPEFDTEGMDRIGEEITETLKYTPASLIKKRIIRPKYIDRKEEKIYIASLPERALPKCIAESCLLSQIIVSKFVDHLPFYRQIQMFKRDYNWKLSSSTLNDWFAACCTLLEPLYNEMLEIILLSGYIQADESPIKVQDSEKKGSTHMGYQWVYSSPVDGITVFQYRKGRGMHGPKEMLSKYEGLLQCDGYKVYDKIGKKKQVTLVGCLAHARRKFYEAQDNDKQKSEYALEIIRSIYEHEKICTDYSFEERKTYRLEKVKPIYIKFKQWLEQNREQVLPKSKIGKAILYTLRQWHKLIAVFADGQIQIDNNLIENKIRPLALGRKNFLFAGSHGGAQRIAMMYSFFATCKQNNVNPYEWMRETLDKLPSTKMSELKELIPSAYG